MSINRQKILMIRSLLQPNDKAGSATSFSSADTFPIASLFVPNLKIFIIDGDIKNMNVMLISHYEC